MEDRGFPPTEEYYRDLQALAKRVNGFLYMGSRLEAILDTVRVLRDDPELAKRLLNTP